MKSPLTWNEYFKNMVELVSSKSKDPSIQVGAIIVNDYNHVVCTGYNGFPRGVEETPERLISPEKYNWVVHAEKNAILQACYLGIPLKGLTMIVSGPSCSECAKAICQSGISRVYTIIDREEFQKTRKTTSDAWSKSWDVAEQMFKEAGVYYGRMAELA